MVATCKLLHTCCTVQRTARKVHALYIEVLANALLVQHAHNCPLGQPYVLSTAGLPAVYHQQWLRQPSRGFMLLQVTGKGPLAQFGVATGVPISQVSIGLLAFISFFLVAAVFEGNYGEESKEDYSQY